MMPIKIPTPSELYASLHPEKYVSRQESLLYVIIRDIMSVKGKWTIDADNKLQNSIILTKPEMEIAGYAHVRDVLTEIQERLGNKWECWIRSDDQIGVFRLYVRSRDPVK